MPWIMICHKACIINLCRRSSVVERAIGNGEADSSILSGGTINRQNKSKFKKLIN